MKGKTRVVAITPAVPAEELPIKIWSTILYNEEISREIIQGMANFLRRDGIGALKR